MIKSPVLGIVDGIFRKFSKFVLRDYFELEDLQSSAKGNSLFVTNAKTRILENLTRELNRKKEDYSIKVPNKNNPIELDCIYKGESNFAFILNPIEGIGNFERANPFFAMVLAIEDIKENSIIASYVYAPALGSCYFAEKGKGSWVESVFDATSRARRMRVAQNNSSSSFLCLQDFVDSDNVFTENLRIIGSSSIAACMLAAGKIDKIHLKNFDYASFVAGKLLIYEAGGKVEEGNDFIGTR